MAVCMNGRRSKAASLTGYRLHPPFKLRREVIRERSHLRRRASAAGVDGVNVDVIKLVVEQDGAELTAFELRPAHPLRNHRYSQPGLDAGDHAFGRSDLHPALHDDRRHGAGSRETPAT